MVRRTQFPQIPAIRSADPQQSKFNAAVREALGMMTGTKTDRVLTRRDIEAGALQGVTLTGVKVDIALPDSSGDVAIPAQMPTKPTGVKANAAMQSVFLQWDLPTYAGHAYTEIYRFDADALALAQPVAKVVYVLFSEFVGSNKTYFYWLRHVNTQGVAGPWNASSGTELTTALDVEEVLRALTLKITESQFTETLLGRIDLIDIANNGGLVAAQAQLKELLEQTDIRLSQADSELQDSLNSAKAFLESQLEQQGLQILNLQSVDEQQAQSLDALVLRSDTIESTVLQLDSVSTTHASRLSTIEFETTQQSVTISELQSVTANQAQAISRLGVYDSVAGKYAFIKTLEEADANMASRTFNLEADNSSTKSRLTAVENVSATHSSRLTVLEVDNGDSKSKITALEATSSSHASRLSSIEVINTTQGATITSLESATAEHAISISRLGAYDSVAGKYAFIKTLEEANADQVSRLSLLEADNGNSRSRIVELETVTALQASQITQVSNQTAIVEDAARAYTDQVTGEIRAERTIKVGADGRVAGIGLVAGGVTGTGIYFSADTIGILPPGATSTDTPVMPFVYDAATGGIYMDTTFIRELTASSIKGGVLNLEQGNIRNLSVFSQLQAPPQCIDEIHLSPALASKLAWVGSPSEGEMTGGSISKVVTSSVGTTAIGSFVSGGQPQTVKISGSGPEELLTFAINGWIDVQLIRNGAAVSINGSTTYRMTVWSALMTDESRPRGDWRWGAFVDGELNTVVAATESGAETSWSVRVVAFSPAMVGEKFKISASVFEAYGSSGGAVGSATWLSLAGKPVTLDGYARSAAAKITFATSGAQLNLPNLGASDPGDTADGDIWFRSNQLYFNSDGTVRTVIHSGNPTELAEDISQEEAEAGISTIRRWFSAERVSQAIAAQAASRSDVENVKNEMDLALAEIEQNLTENPYENISELINEILDNFDRQQDHNEEVVQRQSDTLTLQSAIQQEGETRTSALTIISETIQSESSTRAQQVTQLSSEIVAEGQTRASSIHQLNQTLATESSTRAQQVTELNSQIVQEGQTRSSSISQLNQTLATESSTRAAQVNTLTSQITSESSVRASSINQVNQTIADESSTRALQVNALDSKITTEGVTRAAAISQLNQTVADETSARSTQYNTLDSRITVEGQTRSAAIAQVNETIANETSTRASQYAQLSANDTALLQNLQSVESTVAGTNSTLSILQGTVNNPTNGLSATFVIASEAKTTADGQASAITGLGTRVTNAEGSLSSANLTLSSHANSLGQLFSRAFLGVSSTLNGVTTVNGILVDGQTNSIDFRAGAIRFTDLAGNAQFYWDAATAKFVFGGTVSAATLIGCTIRGGVYIAGEGAGTDYIKILSATPFGTTGKLLEWFGPKDSAWYNFSTHQLNLAALHLVNPSTALSFLTRDGVGFIKNSFFQGQIIESKSGIANNPNGTLIAYANGHQSAGKPVKVSAQGMMVCRKPGNHITQNLIATVILSRGGTQLSTASFSIGGVYEPDDIPGGTTRWFLSYQASTLDTRTVEETRNYSAQVNYVAPPDSYLDSRDVMVDTFENKLAS